MATIYKTKGFVFGREDKAEADRIFTIFTKDFGKINVSGRAIRKIGSKLRSGIDIFYMSDIEFVEGKHQKTLTDATCIKKPNYESVSNKIFIAQRVADILETFLKGQERDDKVFLHVDNFTNLFYQGNKTSNGELIYQYFFWNFLSLQGYHFNVNNCASCGAKLNPYTVYFSCKEGGVICNNCVAGDKTSFKINSDVVKILRIILSHKKDILLKLKVSHNSQEILNRISQDTARRLAPVNS